MADLQQRLKAFVKLGEFFHGFCEYAKKEGKISGIHNPQWEEFNKKVIYAGNKNSWFTKDNILYALESWSPLLTMEVLQEWLSPYPLHQKDSKRILLIMAGNIPLVGFHDFLATLITGNRVLVKLSSNDTILLPAIGKLLVSFEPALENEISFLEGPITQYDAVIATGSNNTSRYFEYYFKNKPHIIRHNRSSVAILTGQESTEELRLLGEDIFRYFGLGCRSVSKLFVPQEYSFAGFFAALAAYKFLSDYRKYANNYDYNKAVYLMSGFPMLDNGFLLLKEDTQYSSPIGTLNYERYEKLEGVKQKLKEDKTQIQCVVSKGVQASDVYFGQTQHPRLQDYADGIDTVEFLLKTSQN